MSKIVNLVKKLKNVDSTIATIYISGFAVGVLSNCYMIGECIKLEN